MKTYKPMIQNEKFNSSFKNFEKFTSDVGSNKNGSIPSLFDIDSSEFGNSLNNNNSRNGRNNERGNRNEDRSNSRDFHNSRNDRDFSKNRRSNNNNDQRKRKSSKFCSCCFLSFF